MQLSVAINAPGKEAYHFQPRLFAKVSHEIHVVKFLAFKSNILHKYVIYFWGKALSVETL